jgi:hypothetical protein
MTQEEVADVQAVVVDAVEAAKPEPRPAPPQALPTPVQIGPAEASAAANTAPAAETAPARRSPRRTTAAAKQADPTTEEHREEPLQQAELTATAAPKPGPPAEQPTQAELVNTAVLEIPKLGSAEALENARQRVNRLLAEGQLSDDGAEKLWTLINRRLQQLEASAAAQPPLS